MKEQSTTTTTEELQASFERMHLTRRAMLWRILSLVERSISDEHWDEVSKVFGELTGVVEGELRNVKRATEIEFGVDGLGSDLFSRTTHRRTPSMDRHRGPPTNLSNPSPKLSQSTRSRPSSIGNSLLPVNNDFAPPHPLPTLGPVASLTALDSETTIMLTSLRSIAAKLHIVNQYARAQLRATRGGTEDDALVDQLLSTHDSLRDDITNLERRWQESRISLRGVLRSEMRFSVSLKRESWTTTDGEGLERLRSIMDAVEDDDDDDLESTLFSSDLATPDMSAAVTDAKAEAFLPPAGLEKIFEAVVDAQLPSSANDVSGAKLSREERILAAKEKRANGNVVPGGRRSSRAMEAGMVAELKDVLTLLKGRNRLPEEL